MDSSLTLWWVIFLNVLVVDVLLWIFGFILDVSRDGRLRLHTIAALLLYVVLGMFIGWRIAAAFWLAGFWVYAIFASAFLARVPASVVHAEDPNSL